MSASPPAAARPDIATTFVNAMKMKQAMLKRGIVDGWSHCPECGGRLRMRLVGPKKHMRFWCEGTCGQQAME